MSVQQHGHSKVGHKGLSVAPSCLFGSAILPLIWIGLEALQFPDPTGVPLIWLLVAAAVLFAITLLLYGRLIAPIAFELKVDYPIFYPNRPGEQRMLVTRLRLSRGATVDLHIYDEFNRHVVALLDRRKLSAGEHFRLWDGRDQKGQLLSGGSYHVRATARATLNSASSAVWVRLDASQDPAASARKRRGDWLEEQFVDRE